MAKNTNPTQHSVQSIVNRVYDEDNNFLYVSTDGGVASGDADSGNPQKIGGVYNASAPTLTDGDRGDLQMDVNGNTKTTLATAIAGEDLTNDVLKVEQRFTGVNVTADAQIKAGAGFLHTVTIMPTDTAATAGTIVLYDNTAESGTLLGTIYINAAGFIPFTLTFDCNFATGLYVGFTTTNDVNVTVSYR